MIVAVRQFTGRNDQQSNNQEPHLFIYLLIPLCFSNDIFMIL